MPINEVEAKLGRNILGLGRVRRSPAIHDYPQKYMINLQRLPFRQNLRILRRASEPVQLRDAPDGQRVRRVREHAALYRSDEATDFSKASSYSRACCR